MPEKHNERMEDYMATVVNLLEKAFGEEERERIEVGEGIMDNTIKNQEERIAKARANFEENKAKYIEEINQIEDETTQNFTNFLEMASKGNTAIDTKTKEISAAAANIGSVLQSTAEIIAQANAKIASAGGIEYTAPTSNGVLADQKKKNQGMSVSQAASQFMNKEMMWTMTNNGATGKSNFRGLGAAIKSGKASDIISSMGEGGMFTHSIRHYLTNNGIDWDSLSDDEKVKMAKDFYNSVTSSDVMKREGNTEYWDAKKNDWSNIKDGIINNGNKSIVSAASNVTKINDGLVQADPKDVAIFAKEGGVIGNFLDNLYNDVHSSNSGSIKLDTINVSISGSLDLSSGGQSVNIINELQNDPILLRSLSRMLAEHISKSMNGGRGNSNLSIGSI